MYQEINLNSFVDAFKSIRPENFSHNGLTALFNYLIEYEESTDEKIKLDVIALCCTYTEYDSAVEAVKQYKEGFCVDLEKEGSVDLVEVAELEKKEAIKYLEERTQVIEFDNGGIIIQNF